MKKLTIQEKEKLRYNIKRQNHFISSPQTSSDVNEDRLEKIKQLKEKSKLSYLNIEKEISKYDKIAPFKKLSPVTPKIIKGDEN